MSAHLGFESYQIPLGSSLTDCYNTIKAAITSRGWQVIGGSEGMMIQQVLADGTWHHTSHSRETAWNSARTAGDSSGRALGTGSLDVAPFWSGVKFVAPVDVRKIKMDMLEVTWATLGYALRAFSLDYSDDGVGWTTLQSFGAINWIEEGDKVFLVTNASMGAHSYWRINVTTRGSSNSWTLVNKITLYDASGNNSILNGWIQLDVIPPVSEQIGDANGFDFCRIQFNSSGITFTPKTRYPNGFKQALGYNLFAAGNNIPSITINGQTVAVSAGLINAANTAIVNMQLLYEALTNSVNSTFTDYAWEMLEIGSGWDTLVGTKKTAGAWLTTSVNCTAIYYTGECPPGTDGQTYSVLEDSAYNTVQSKTVACDLVNGFVYYLQINARTLGLATKTNTGYFGPMFLSYTDHAQAIAEMPQDKRYCTPIELFLVRGPEATTHYGTSQTFFTTAKLRGRRNSPEDRYPVNGNFNNYGAPFHVANFCHGNIGIEVDCKPHYAWTNLFDTNDSSTGTHGTSMFGGYTFHYYQLAARGSLHSLSYRAGVQRGVDVNAFTSQYLPPFSLPDVKRHITHNAVVYAVTNENALMSPDKSVTTLLVSQINTADTPTTVAVVDASQLPSSGAVSIQGEIWKYTSKSGNTLVGCTRAQYSTTARTLYAGAKINPITWYIKINDFALAAGYTRP